MIRLKTEIIRVVVVLEVLVVVVGLASASSLSPFVAISVWHGWKAAVWEYQEASK